MLDSRQIRILRWLIEHREPLSTASLASGLGLSQRVVRYRLSGLGGYLRTLQLSLEQKPGVGIWISGSGERIEELRGILEALDGAPRVLAAVERGQIMRAVLLIEAPDPVTLETLHNVMEVSTTTGRRDLKEIEPWIESHGLRLARRSGVGISVIGPEPAIRRAFVKLLLESVPSDAMREVAEVGIESAALVQTRISSGLREILKSLPIRKCADVVVLHKGAFRGEESSEIVLTLYLATSLLRLSRGHQTEMDAGQLRSLLDHPVSEAAAGIAVEVGKATETSLPDEEVAGITSMLLGFGAPVSEPRNLDADIDRLVDEVLRIASAELHPILEDDPELRRSLTQHLERLVVRLDYDVPVHNPLLREVSERYPSVHTVSRQIGSIMEASLERPLPEDELGFITMYLSGAMERTHLWPRRRVVVVCPSGMATVWILVSRIQAEFPQLELGDVVSAGNFDPQNVDGDVVISTVDIPGVDAVVVNPLLRPDDVRAIASRVARPY